VRRNVQERERSREYRSNDSKRTKLASRRRGSDTFSREEEREIQIDRIKRREKRSEPRTTENNKSGEETNKREKET